jgi:hypothetical protein
MIVSEVRYIEQVSGLWQGGYFAHADGSYNCYPSDDYVSIIGPRSQGYPSWFSGCAKSIILGLGTDDLHPDIYVETDFTATESYYERYTFHGDSYILVDQGLGCHATGERSRSERRFLRPLRYGEVVTVTGQHCADNINSTDQWIIEGESEDEVILRVSGPTINGQEHVHFAVDAPQGCIDHIRTGWHGGAKMWSGHFTRMCKFGLTVGMNGQKYVLEAQRNRGAYE